MIPDKIFNNISSSYKSYPYKSDIYVLRDENNSGYIYTGIGEDVNNSALNEEIELSGHVLFLPLFYEKDFAIYFISGFSKPISVKMISHSTLKLLNLWCENDKVTPVFFTTVDRRNSGEKEIDKNKNNFKKPFIHFLFNN
jgi:hypothetical protein